MFYFYKNTKDGLTLKQLTCIFLNVQKIDNKDDNVPLVLTIVSAQHLYVFLMSFENSWQIQYSFIHTHKHSLTGETGYRAGSCLPNISAHPLTH